MRIAESRGWGDQKGGLSRRESANFTGNRLVSSARSNFLSEIAEGSGEIEALSRVLSQIEQTTFQELA